MDPSTAELSVSDIPQSLVNLTITPEQCDMAHRAQLRTFASRGGVMHISLPEALRSSGSVLDAVRRPEGDFIPLLRGNGSSSVARLVFDENGAVTGWVYAVEQEKIIQQSADSKTVLIPGVYLRMIGGHSGPRRVGEVTAVAGEDPDTALKVEAIKSYLAQLPDGRWEVDSIEEYSPFRYDLCISLYDRNKEVSGEISELASFIVSYDFATGEIFRCDFCTPDSDEWHEAACQKYPMLTHLPDPVVPCLSLIPFVRGIMAECQKQGESAGIDLAAESMRPQISSSYPEIIR